MKKLFLALCAVLPVGALSAGDILFNSSFELGTEGFAIRRFLTEDTNPKLTFTPWKLDAGRTGKYSLKVENPFKERTEIVSVEFPLKKQELWRFSMWVKADAENRLVNADLLTIDQKWVSSNKQFRAGKEWKQISMDVTTQVDGFYHICLSIGQQKGTLWFDDLKLERIGVVASQEAALDTSAVSKELYHLEDGSAELELKVWNRSKQKIERELTVRGIADYSGDELFRKTFTVTLNPGETLSQKFTERLQRYGCVRIETTGKDVHDFPGWFAVIGRYVPGKVDVRKDAVISFDMEPLMRKPPVIRRPWARGFGMGVADRYALVAKSGCRMIRDHWTAAWGYIEEKRGVFDFSTVDQIYELCEKNNFVFFPIVRGDFIEGHQPYELPRWPKWVQPLCTRVKNDPPNVLAAHRGKILLPPLDLWSKFIYKFTEHMKGKNCIFEINNEPNLYLSPENYVTYLAEASKQIRKADPERYIVGFCISSDFAQSTSDWTKEIVKLDALKYADALSFHPYFSRQLGSPNPADKDIAGLRETLGKKDYPIWNTELYYLFDPPKDAHYDGRQQEQIQPHHFVSRFLIDIGEGVTQSNCLGEPQLWKRRHTNHIYDTISSLTTLTPSDIFVVCNSLARLFEAAKPVQKIRLPHDTICYVFRKDKQLIAGLWNYGHRKGVHANFNGFEVMDVFGNPLAAANLPVTESVLYLKQGNMSETEFIKRLKGLSLQLECPVEVSGYSRAFNGSVAVGLSNYTKTPAEVLLFSGSAVNEQTIQPGENKSTLLSIENPGKSLDVNYRVDGRNFFGKMKIEKNQYLAQGEKFHFASKDGQLSGYGTVIFNGDRCELSMRVQDKTNAGPSGKREFWETDSVELFIDLAPCELLPGKEADYNNSVFRVFLMPRDSEKPFALWSKKLKESDFKKHLAADENGYSLSLSFPAPKGRWLGFAVKVNDAENEKSKTKRSAGWGFSPIAISNRLVFGIIDRTPGIAVRKTILEDCAARWIEEKPIVTECTKRTENGVRGIYYTGAEGRRHFAWIGIPESASPEKRVPGIVLVHGGGATAYADWVRFWNTRGYAAIAMDTNSCLPAEHDYRKIGATVSDETLGESIPQFKNGAIGGQWFYHALSSVISAHSVLRSFPEVDSGKTGITGVSWGGVLTEVAASLDPRFACAVPVYGSGALSESCFAQRIAERAENTRDYWINEFDPLNYLAQSKIPFLYVTGVNDHAFYLPLWTKTVAATPGAELCLRQNYWHAHGKNSEELPEICAFFDSKLKNKEDAAPRISFPRRNGKTLNADVSNSRINSAKLHFTQDSGAWKNRKWQTLPASFKDGELSAPLPDSWNSAYFEVNYGENMLRTSPVLFN